MGDVKDLDRVLAISDKFEAELDDFLALLTFGDTEKSRAVVAMSCIVFEHASSLRVLVNSGLPTSAMALLRLQYDAIVKQLWLTYSASELEVKKALTPLTLENEQKEKNSQVSTNTMLADLAKNAHPSLYRQLSEFKTYSGKALNSFVHGGIHAVSRKIEGYPIALLLQAIKSSNNLISMSSMGLTELLGDYKLSLQVAEISKRYAECLQLSNPVIQG